MAWRVRDEAAGDPFLRRTYHGVFSRTRSTFNVQHARPATGTTQYQRRSILPPVIVSLLFFGLPEADAAEVRAAIPILRGVGMDYLTWNQVRNNRRLKKAFGKFNYGAVIRTILLSSI